MEKKAVVCPICGQGYNEGETCWNSKSHSRYDELPDLIKDNTKSKNEFVKIPQGNIDAYLHWYNLLKKIQNMKFTELDFDEPLNILKGLQERWGLPKDWLWTVYKPINIKQCEETDLHNPFRRVWHFMQRGKITHKVPCKDLYPNTPSTSKGSFYIRDYSKKREGAKTNWPLNVLLCGLVDDCHWYGKGKKFAEARAILDGLSIPEANTFEYDSFQKHCRGIDRSDINNLLEALYEACNENKIAFIPIGTSISEWPTDFLAIVADHTGYKINPVKHLTDQMREALPEHLKKLARKRSNFRK